MSDKQPTLEEVAEKAQMDLDRWEVKSYNVSLSSEGKWWARLEAKPVLSSADYKKLAKEISQVLGNDYPQPEYSYPSTDIVGVLGLYDTHFGVGDQEEKENQLIDAAHSLVSIVDPSLLILPIAGDIFHADSAKLTTTKGTFVGDDFSGNWHEVVHAGYRFIGRLILSLSSVFMPIRVIVVPGNHDRETSFGLGMFLGAYFQEHKYVEVDSRYAPVKYASVGVTLLGFMHGDKYKKGHGISLMANDVPELWSQSKYRELHHGHYHAEMVKDETGVVVRCNPGLSNPSNWELFEGYRRQHPAMVCYEYHLEEGLMAIHQRRLTNQKEN